MTLVLDASAVVDVLLASPRGRALNPAVVDPSQPLVTAAHLDAEVLSALARLHREGVLSAEDVRDRLTLLAALDAARLPITQALLDSAWALRANVAARDALYVALANRLGARLVTTDDRLRRAVPDLVL